MTTTTKKPTAAELARREAQSKADTGVPEPVEVEVFGETVTVDPVEFKSLSFLNKMTILQDESKSDDDRLSAMMEVLRRLLGPATDRVFDAAGDVENAGEILRILTEAVNPS